MRGYLPQFSFWISKTLVKICFSRKGEKVFLHGLLNMREKQILTSVIEIKIEGNHAFFEDN